MTNGLVFILATCEICGLATIYESNAFSALGAVISWCKTCTPEQTFSVGDGGTPPHHVVGHRLTTSLEVYLAWKAGRGNISIEEAIPVTQKLCGGRQEYGDCSECLYDPCPVREYFS